MGFTCNFPKTTVKHLIESFFFLCLKHHDTARQVFLIDLDHFLYIYENQFIAELL